MKKYFLFAGIILAVIFLSGCSLTSGTATKEPAANPNNSIWVSNDAGKKWENNYLPGNKESKKINIANADVISMAINPFDPKNVFAGLRGPGILKTDDGGRNWEYLTFQSEKVYGLDIHPFDGRIIYASGVWQNRGKIFKSFDAGANWEEIYTTASVGPLVISLAIDKRNPEIVYAGTSDNQIIKTSDGGNSWKNIFVAQNPVTKIVLDHKNSNLLYGITQGAGIIRSADGGRSFESISNGPKSELRGNQSFFALETDPRNTGWVYLAGGAGILRSKDAGETWEKIQILSNPQTFPVRALAISPSNPNQIIYGAAQAAYRSLDGGVNWETFQFNAGKIVNVIKFSEVDPNQLYLGFIK